jgi:type IV secretion system protein VirD4
MTRPTQIGIAVAIYLALFTVLASIIFLALSPTADGSMLIAYYDYPVYQWWSYWLCCYSYPAVYDGLVQSGLAAALPPLIAVAAIAVKLRRITGRTLQPDWATSRLPRPAIRGVTDNYGHARWASLREMRALWPGPSPLYGGVVVGEAYDPRVDRGPFSAASKASWGHGGKAPLLIDLCRDGSTHSLVIAGSGSYKTTGHAIPTLLTWTGAAVVLDPATELGPMLAADRRRMGHRVFILSPQNAALCGFNVLDWIDITSPMAETDVAAVVEWICGYTSRRDQTAQFFKDGGKRLITCLLAHILWDPELAPDLKTLYHLRNAISVPETELRVILKRIHESSPSTMARHLAGPLCKLVDETFSGIFANAAEDTAWLTTRAYADLVSGSAFKAADIVRGDTDVFIALPLKALEATPAIGRCIVGALLNAVYEANGNLDGRVLFLHDEAATLGNRRDINVARVAGRKFGITLHLLYQSIGQIEGQWGPEGKRAWYEAVTWRAYAAVKDLETAKELSETIGNYGVRSRSRSTGRTGRLFGSSSISSGTTISEHARARIRPEEIMHDLREDAAIVVPKNGRPALCGRAIYFRRPEFLARVAANRFARGGVDGRPRA